MKSTPKKVIICDNYVYEHFLFVYAIERKDFEELIQQKIPINLIPYFSGMVTYTEEGVMYHIAYTTAYSIAYSVLKIAPTTYECTGTFDDVKKHIKEAIRYAYHRQNTL